MDICEICYNAEKDVILPCNHKVCCKCFKHIDKCAFCRADIPKTNKLLRKLIKHYNSPEPDSGLTISEDYTFANFIFYDEPDKIYFIHKLNKTNITLYNPEVYDNQTVMGSGKYIFENIPKISRFYKKLNLMHILI